MSSTPTYVFDEKPSLSWLGLPGDYEPSPRTATSAFLLKHLPLLPQHLLVSYSSILDPKSRTSIPIIRNRRLAYTQSNPPEFRFNTARSTWPTLWQGRERRGGNEANEEREWVANSFMQGSARHVEKLGDLLADYEEERDAERMRALRRERAADNFVPEEESDIDEDEDPEPITEPENEEEAQASFERRVRERFIYGLLEASYFPDIYMNPAL